MAQTAEADLWSKTAFWAYQAIHGPMGIEQMFRQECVTELMMQPTATLY